MKFLKSKIIILIVVLSIAQFSCKNKEEDSPTKTVSLSKKEDEAKSTLVIDCLEEGESGLSESNFSNQVFIDGKTDDSAAFKYFNVLRFSGLGYGISGYPEEKKVRKDSLFFTIEKVDRPQLVELVAFSGRENTSPYSTRFLITPEDSVSLDINEGEMHFTGKNAANYNFFIAMEGRLGTEEPYFKNDPFVYKKELKESYLNKKAYLKEYAKRNRDMTEDSKKLIEEELKFEYLYNLILPRNVKDPETGSYHNSQKHIAFEFIKANPNHEGLLDLNEYFEEVTLEDFKKPELFHNDYYRRALTQYLRYYFTDYDFMDFSRTNFKNEKQFIQENLSGELETYAISRLINDYYENGFGHGQEEIPLLKNLIKEYKDRFSAPSYCTKINEIISDLDHYSYEIPENALEEKLLTFAGDTIRFSEVLNHRTKPAKVIDFWASWCGPCITTMKNSKTYRDKLKRKNIADFIYISIDEDQEQWLNRVSNLENYFSKENQYLIIDRQSSKILDKMNIMRSSKAGKYFSIPRYSILNRENKIISSNAPSPVDSTSFDRVIERNLN